MQRTEYFNQTRPSSTQLNWTEDSRTTALTRRLRSAAQMGVVSGFQVTVNGADNTKIDIAGGEGYTGGMYLINTFEGEGSGERISTYVDTPTGTADIVTAATQLSLADYTDGVANYVSLVFSEVDSYPLEERSYPFTSHNTVVTESFTTSVLSATDWGNLTSTELNNRILVAIVTANGVGVPLTSNSIEQVVQPKTMPTATQPGTLSGVLITGVADTTPLGTATLRWASSTNRLYYTAPGDSEGTGITITNSGTYTIYSYTTTYWLTLNVNYGSLSGEGDTSEDITIQSLYGRTIPLFSGVDQLHRDMVGSGHPSVTNPHGLTLDDIGGGTYDHADLFHVNGISKDAESDQLQCTAYTTGVYEDNVLITNLGGFANSFLIDGVTLELLNGYSAGTPAAIDFGGFADSGDYLIYVTSGGDPGYVIVAGSTTDTWSFWSTNVKLMDVHNTTAGTGTITWDDADYSLTWQSPADASPGDKVYVSTDSVGNHTGYYKLFSDTTDDWILIRVDGDLGSGDSSDITVTKDETDYSDETILKLSIVHWNANTDTLSELRDIRNYITADVHDEFRREHDADGLHTVPLQQPFYVNAGTVNGAVNASAANIAVQGVADTIYGMYASAPNSALYASADTNVAIHAVATAGAVWASARNTAVYGTVATNTAVLGKADNYGVYGSAGTLDGVYGTASGRGVRGNATNFGVFGSAAEKTGVYGTATHCALAGNAIGDSDGQIVGLAVSATNTNATNAVSQSAAGVSMYISGLNATGVYGRICGSATNGIGLYGYQYADAAATAQTGVYGFLDQANATNGIGVYGRNDASIGSAYGVKGEAGAGVGIGVYGTGGTIGVLGSAPYKGVRGFATGSMDANIIGVHGEASNTNGDAASNSALGGWFVGSALNATGIHGQAAAAATYGIGVYGVASVSAGSAAHIGVYGYQAQANASDGIGVIGKNVATLGNPVGIYAEATGAGGTGLHANGLVAGVYAQASNLAVHAIAATNTGLYAQADDTAGYFRASGTVAGTLEGAHVVATNMSAGEYAAGVKGYASASSIAYGLYGYAGGAATCYGVYGYADAATEIGVCGAALTNGVVGIASETAIKGTATVSMGVFGSAPVIGVRGEAEAVGVQAVAGNSALVAQATSQVNGAVVGATVTASNTSAGKTAHAMTIGADAGYAYGLIVTANASVSAFGISASANNGKAGVFTASTGTAIQGVIGPAPVAAATAIHGDVTNNANAHAVGVYGNAQNNSVASKAYGLYGVATGANAAGVFGFAADGYGIEAAGLLNGVRATGSVIGVYGKCNCTAGTVGYGLWAECANTDTASNAVGIYALAGGAGATAARFSAPGANGIGLQAVGIGTAISAGAVGVALHASGAVILENQLLKNTNAYQTALIMDINGTTYAIPLYSTAA